MSTTTQLWLRDGTGFRRESFSIGESIFVAGRGLLPSQIYEFSVRSERDRGPKVQLVRYTMDRHGSDAGLLLPYAGLSADEKASGVSIEGACKAFRSKSFYLSGRTIGREKHLLDELKFAIAAESSKPRLFSSDQGGRLQTNLEQGRDGIIAVNLRNFPKGCVRVFVVRRQFGWRVGDPIEPVITRKGALAIITITHDGSRHHIVNIVPVEILNAGSYKFIARAYRPGWYNADELTFLQSDIVSDQAFLLCYTFPKKSFR